MLIPVVVYQTARTTIFTISHASIYEICRPTPYPRLEIRPQLLRNTQGGNEERRRSSKMHQARTAVAARLLLYVLDVSTASASSLTP